MAEALLTILYKLEPYSDALHHRIYHMLVGRKNGGSGIIMSNEIFLKQQRLHEVLRKAAREAVKKDTPFIPKKGSEFLDLKTQVFSDDTCKRLYPDFEEAIDDKDVTEIKKS